MNTEKIPQNNTNSSMKVLLIMPDYGERDFYIMSVGLMHISSYLKAKGYAVHCLNLNHHSISKLIETLQMRSFDVVGTGGLYMHFPIIKSLIGVIRKYNPQAKIVIGGGIASTDFEFVFEALQPDILVVGEGEKTTDILLQALKNNSDLYQVTGIIFKDDGKLIKTPPTPLIENLDELPYLDYEGFEYRYYLDNFSPKDQEFCNIVDISRGRVAYVISGRGCIMKCTFCFRVMGSQFKKGSYRARSLKHFYGEIRYLIEEYGINGLGIMDDMFAADKKRIAEFCEMIKPFNLKWQCQLRVNVVDDELIATMKHAGCYLISYGFESGSPAVLKSMRKGITPDEIERAIKASLKAKITIQGNFIFGDPAETIETVKETIIFSRKFKLLHIGFGWIVPYPGSQLYNQCVESGKIKDKESFYKNPFISINMTSLSDIDFKYITRKISLEKRIRQRFSSGKILKKQKIEDNTYHIKIRCQHCCNINNFTIKINPEKVYDVVICEYCYQRIAINTVELKFFKIAGLFRQAGHRYVLKLLTVNHRAYSLFSSLVHKTRLNKIIRKLDVV